MRKKWVAVCLAVLVVLMSACRYYTPEQTPVVCVSKGMQSVSVDVSALGDDMPVEEVLRTAQLTLGAQDLLWCISRDGNCVAINAAAADGCRVGLKNDVVSVRAADNLALNGAHNIHLPMSSVDELVVWTKDSDCLELLYDEESQALTDAEILTRLGLLRQVGEVVTYNRYRAVGYELKPVALADWIKDGYAVRVVLQNGTVVPIDKSSLVRCYWYHGRLRVEGYTECVAQIQYVSV